jgi:hypothetical protein
MDVTAIEAGHDFRKAIEEGVTKCGVLLVVIGPDWLNAKNERGTRRLDDPSDFVRIETASALKRDIPVVPVLVRGAEMPSAEQLPKDLKELAYRNCIELTHVRWRSDFQLLAEALQRLLGHSRPDSTGRAPANRQVQAEMREAIAPEVLQRASRELAYYIGQIAHIVVKRAAAGCSSAEDLYLKIAEEIDSPAERKKFLLSHAVGPSILASEFSRAAGGYSNISY